MVDASLLFDASKKIPEPKIPKVGELGFKEAMGISEPYMEKKRELQPKIAGADAAIEEAKRKQKLVEVTGESTAIKKQAEDVRTAQDTYQTQLEAEPLPAFIPDKESAKDIAGLFSMVSVMGMLLGGGGKLNAMQALNAMNGMLEGHQKGRADLYKKQATEFDKNFKSMLKKHEEFRKKMEDAIKLAAVDKEAGMADARMAAVESGSNIIKAMLDKGNLVGAYKALDESQALAENAFKTVINEQDKAETRRLAADREASAERRHKEDREAAERRHKEDREAAERRHLATMAQRKALAQMRKEDSPKGNFLKPGAKISEAYVADNQLKTDIEDITNDLKNNPSLVKDLEKYRIEAFLTEEGKVLNQLVSSDIPPNLRQFLTKVRDVRNNYYLNISGKAVTGGEALRSYGTVPQPGDDAPNMINKLNGMSKRVSQAISIKQQLYGLPNLNLNAGGETSLVPNRDYSKNEESEPASSEAVARPKVYEPKTAEEFKAVPPEELYIDPGDRKIYRKPK
jgi:hypothetical protein